MAKKINTTDKKSVRELVNLLSQYGIKHAIMSPGSRNAPLLVALERNPDIETYMVIDERSAAFIALGLAAKINSPVALVCTSGTAPLNYSPAIAEAYYRNIPLIVITADRPYEWIDQDDSQTINQNQIYKNYIKGSFDIPVESDEIDKMWYINRTLNDALALAVDNTPGPIHINVRLAEPLNGIVEIDESENIRKIDMLYPTEHTFDMSKSISTLCNVIEQSKAVLIVSGFLSPQDIVVPLEKLARLPNVVITHEAQSNLHHSKHFIHNIDATLRCMPESAPNPDLVISLGGSLTSRMIKSCLRSIQDLRHWSIGNHVRSVDSFKHLTQRIKGDTANIITQLANHLTVPPQEPNVFKALWLKASESAMQYSTSYADVAPWSDFKAMSYIIENIPSNYDLQLSNGTSVRYAQLFDYRKIARIDCNRGVSGIDGCTSTAIGAAIGSNTPTILITGDMSFQYDMGAIATEFIPSNFKIVVLSNGGGGIFRFIQATRDFDELERCFAGPINLPLMQLAEAYDFNYFKAETYDQLVNNFDLFLEADNKPSILEIITDGNISADILSKYFKK